MQATMGPINSSHLYPATVLLPLFSGIAILIDLPPLMWHCRNRNVSAASLVLWILLLNLLNIINASIWPRNDVQHWWNGVGLCDIESKLYVGAWIALSGSIASVMRTLANIMDTSNQSVIQTTAQRRRELVIELCLCFGFPMLIMGLSYLVQPYRFYVFGIAGCVPAFDNSWPTVVLVFIWPLVLILVAAFYSVLLVLRMHRYRNEFALLLELSHTAKSRFIRLFSMSLFAITAFIPLETYILYRNVTVTPLQPYSWSRVHSPQWSSSIFFIPSDGTYVFDRWVYMGCGYAVFIFFGLGAEALNSYRATLIRLGFATPFPSLTRPLHHSTSSSPSSSSSTSSPLSPLQSRQLSNASANPSSPGTRHTTILTRLCNTVRTLFCHSQSTTNRHNSSTAGLNSMCSTCTDGTTASQLEKGGLDTGGTLITTTLTSTISDAEAEGALEMKPTMFF